MFGDNGLVLDPLHLALAAVCIGLAAFLMRVRGELQRQCLDARSAEQEHKHQADLALGRYEGLLDKEQTERQRLESELAETRRELATARHAASQAREQMARAETRSAEDEQRFRELASQAVDQASRRFLTLADQNFATHKEGAKGQLESLVKPLRDSISSFTERVDAIEKTRTSDKSSLEQQVTAIRESLQHHTKETGRLVTALSAPKGAGRWGEMTLRNVLEQAGLSDYCDFLEQVTDKTEDGVQRPDVEIRLPGNRSVVVDAKASTAHFLEAVDAAEPERSILLKKHADAVWAHAGTLGSKKYQDNVIERLDFVVMFIPGENFFSAALQQRPGLVEKALEKNVIIATPATLISMAKTIAMVWQQDEMTANIRAASEAGRILHRRLATFAGYLDKVGVSLGHAVGHYNEAIASFRSRLLPGGERMEELGLRDPAKSMDALKLEAITTEPDRNTGVPLLQAGE